jgi:phosphohistidine swiveling domain-containing protein
VTEPRIVEIEDTTDGSCGGKAAGLARLRAMGLRVPPAFAIRNASRTIFPLDLELNCARLGNTPLAVRSSADSEDGATASFAGQYLSVLGVTGTDAVRDAIRACVASLDTGHAGEYRRQQEGERAAVMHLVVQQMVNARCAGVVFTADPASARRDLLVIDAVEGLGDSLVSGSATPDHYALDTGGRIVRRLPVHDTPVLSDAEIARIAEQARRAARLQGEPLDLEWAIDHHGELFWLQARPITTLPADLNELDTPLPRPDDVLTTCNVSEMMPGAVCPLTGSFTGWGIDYGLQHMQRSVGVRHAIDPAWQITAWSHGHLFLNLTGNTAMVAGVLGSSVEQTAQSLCGRVVPELRAPAPMPLQRRMLNTIRLLRYCLGAPAAVRKFDAEMESFRLQSALNSRDAWREIASKAGFFEHAMAVHIRSSALSGFLCALVENIVSRTPNDSTGAEQGRAAALLGGATGVESAVMLQQLDALADRVADEPGATAGFVDATPEQALAWMRSRPETASALSEFLRTHGHRGYRELCMRDPSWADEPAQLVHSLQAAVRSRIAGHRHHEGSRRHAALPGINGVLGWLLPRAHDAIRRREHTKSHLVRSAHRFKVAFRRLAELLVQEGTLPDADLLFFFTMDELEAVVSTSRPELVSIAQARRAAFGYQQRLEFPEICTGSPSPLEEMPAHVSNGVLQGRPASGGIVEGKARVAHTLEEAALLQPGEILVTPITDIGWTPYFSVIAGLVTDLGSSVSHGAVIAREYGLPCVVNTRNGTRAIKTGDHLMLDGYDGTVRLSTR